MKLELKERFMIPRLYPRKASLAVHLTIRALNEKIKVEAKEKKDVGLKNEGGNIVWNPKKDKVKDVDFTTLEINFLKDQVTRVDKEQAITPDMVDLCVKIKDYKVEEEKKVK